METSGGHELSSRCMKVVYEGPGIHKRTSNVVPAICPNGAEFSSVFFVPFSGHKLPSCACTSFQLVVEVPLASPVLRQIGNGSLSTLGGMKLLSLPLRWFPLGYGPSLLCMHFSYVGLNLVQSIRCTAFDEEELFSPLIFK